MIRFAVLLLTAAAALAQTSVSQTEKPSNDAVEARYYRDGSNNLEYTCEALATQPKDSVWTRSASTSMQPNTPSSVGQKTLTSIADSGTTGTVNITAHGLSVGQWVTVSGATVDTDLNGTYVVVTASANSFTITTANVTDATYNEATLKVVSAAPRTNAMIWAVRKFYYTGTYIDRSVPAIGSNGMVRSCDSRTTYF